MCDPVSVAFASAGAAAIFHGTVRVAIENRRPLKRWALSWRYVLLDIPNIPEFREIYTRLMIGLDWVCRNNSWSIGEMCSVGLDVDGESRQLRVPAIGTRVKLSEYVMASTESMVGSYGTINALTLYASGLEKIDSLFRSLKTEIPIRMYDTRCMTLGFNDSGPIYTLLLEAIQGLPLCGPAPLRVRSAETQEPPKREVRYPQTRLMTFRIRDTPTFLPVPQNGMIQIPDYPDIYIRVVPVQGSAYASAPDLAIHHSMSDAGIRGWLQRLLDRSRLGYATKTLNFLCSEKGEQKCPPDMRKDQDVPFAEPSILGSTPRA